MGHNKIIKLDTPIFWGFYLNALPTNEYE